MSGATGVRRGWMPLEVVHLAGPSKAGTLCGRKPKKWGYRPRASLDEAKELCERQACRICEACAGRVLRLLGEV